MWYCTTKSYTRVEDVEDSVDNVWNEVDVALAASSSRVHAEWLFSSKAQEKQFGVVDVELVGGLPLACALLQICVVPAQQREDRREWIIMRVMKVYLTVFKCRCDFTLLSM